MLHATQNRIDHLFNASGEWCWFPAASVTFDAQAVGGGRQTGQSDTIISMRKYTPGGMPGRPSFT